MKKFITIIFVFTGISCRASADTAQGPNFFAVENDRQSNQQMVILPFKCTAGKNISWNDEYQTALNGLNPGSRIKAYSREGANVSGTLGSPTCFAGECNANYVALPITLNAELNEVLVVSKNIHFEINAVEVIENENCAGIPDDRKNPYGFDFVSLLTECHDIVGVDSSGKIHGQTVSFGWQQENGWDVFHQFFRSVSNESGTNIIYGPLLEVTYDTSKQFPIFGFNRKNEKLSLLWYQRSGLGPVSSFNLRESTINESGDVHWNSEYIAGGQPCD